MPASAGGSDWDGIDAEIEAKVRAACVLRRLRTFRLRAARPRTPRFCWRVSERCSAAVPDVVVHA